MLSNQKLILKISLVILIGISVHASAAYEKPMSGGKPETVSYCKDEEIQIKNFRTVSIFNVAPSSKYDCDETYKSKRAVMRGARLGSSKIAAEHLYNIHVKTILNLEGEDHADKENEMVLKVYRSHDPAATLNYVNIALSGNNSPTQNQVDQILEVISNPDNYPIYIHCKRGIDRTGFAVGLLRVLEGWSADEAISEWDTFRDSSSRLVAGPIFEGGKVYIHALADNH